MATKKEGKSQEAALAQQLITGTAKHLTSATSVPLLGSSFTPAQITAKLQTIVTLRSDVNSAKATTKAKVAAEKAQLPALRAFVSAFESYLKAAYGGSPDVLADFGITPKARAPLTVEAKAAAAAKGAATRAARHTTGSKQKKAIKGAVTGVVVSPITASTSTLATPGSPAPAATSGSGSAATPAPAAPATSGSTPAAATHSP